MKTDKEWLERARELLRRSDNFISHTTEQMALQLGLEMADGRAEEIARLCEHYLSDAESIRGTTSVGAAPGLRSAANLARSTITPKRPKTREQVLEGALLEVLKIDACRQNATVSQESQIARRALEWTP